MGKFFSFDKEEDSPRDEHQTAIVFKGRTIANIQFNIDRINTELEGARARVQNLERAKAMYEKMLEALSNTNTQHNNVQIPQLSEDEIELWREGFKKYIKDKTYGIE